MKISDLFKFSTDNLRRRKGRTILTVIGVVVGVCAIVVMISLGIAVNRATDEMLSTWGDLTKIEVNRYGAQQGTPDLDDRMLEQFKELPHVTAATPIVYSQVPGEIFAGKNKRYGTWASVQAMDAAAIQPMGYELLTGNYLGQQNAGRNKIPVMVEANAIFQFYDSNRNERSPNYMKQPQYDENDEYQMNPPINLPQYDDSGNLLNPEDSFFDFMDTPLVYRVEYGYDETTGEPQYKEYELVVVGILSLKGYGDLWGSFVMDTEDMVKIENDIKKLSGNTGGSSFGGSAVSYGGMMGGGESDTVEVGGYDTVYVKVDSVENMPEVEQAVKGTGYQIYSMSEERTRLQGQVGQTQMMLGGLAAVSLFVAALNIANTMTMAIYERTKEIGVMKVLGCRLPNIRQMFLIESGTIGLLGGVVGVIFSFLISLLLNYLPMLLALLQIDGTVDIAGMFGMSELTSVMPEAQLSVIPPWLIVMALAFATGVGILSGIAPANRAVKISSLEAIRHE